MFERVIKATKACAVFKYDDGSYQAAGVTGGEVGLAMDSIGEPTMDPEVAISALREHLGLVAPGAKKKQRRRKKSEVEAEGRAFIASCSADPPASVLAEAIGVKVGRAKQILDLVAVEDDGLVEVEEPAGA